MYIYVTLLDAEACEHTNPELFHMLNFFAILSLAMGLVTAVMLPFWVANWRKPSSVLDVRNRKGICFEPVVSHRHRPSASPHSPALTRTAAGHLSVHLARLISFIHGSRTARRELRSSCRSW